MQQICAVIAAKNEEQSISNVLRQLHRAGLKQCLTVVNGSSDTTALRARNTGIELGLNSRVIQIQQALGIDVPRAIGALWAWRIFHPDYFLFLDGDWGGSFGPALESFCSNAIEKSHLATYVAPAHRAIYKNSDLLDPTGTTLRLDETIWLNTLNSVLPRDGPVMPRAAVNQLPLLIHKRVFQVISTYWLHHPGIWFALLTQVGLRHERFHPSVDATWMPQLVGNATRSRKHALLLRETLIGDALDGASVLLGRRYGRQLDGHTYSGFHGERRVDVLRELQSSWEQDM